MKYHFTQDQVRALVRAEAERQIRKLEQCMTAELYSERTAIRIENLRKICTKTEPTS